MTDSQEIHRPGSGISLPLQGGEVEHYLRERYQVPGAKRNLHSMYYTLRPLIPRGVQLIFRRWYASIQSNSKFPAWPIEPLLIDKQNEALKNFMISAGVSRWPFVNFWPDGKRSSIVLTHDVETAEGVANIERVRKLEEKYGVVSSWNFVPERYKFDKGIFRTLRDQGCEIGVHGLYHDGKTFSSRRVFDERLPRINSFLREWQAVGFRSPATHRNADWMPLIAAEYDSSFPDTDPFEPQAGGCCSIFPFFLGRLVELPITMPQDHTLFEILRYDDISVWEQKARWLIDNRGMVLVIIHPDYMLSKQSLGQYERLLGFLREQESVWFALPMNVARWWKDRAASDLVTLKETVRIEGPSTNRGSILWAELHGSEIAYSDSTI